MQKHADRREHFRKQNRGDSLQVGTNDACWQVSVRKRSESAALKRRIGRGVLSAAAGPGHGTHLRFPLTFTYHGRPNNSQYN
jgi:hypothetical protein